MFPAIKGARVEPKEALFEAIQKGDAGAVRALLARDPRQAAARNPLGVSALMWAQYHRRADLVEALLAAGAEMDIFEASALGRLERVRELLERGPGLERGWSADGATALHFACFFAHEAVAELLVAHGADIHSAARGFGQVTPLHSAAAGRSPRIVELLLGAGARPDARQQGGFTALHSAAQQGNLEMVRTLVSYGADPRLPNDDGRTALDLAREKGHREVAELLENPPPRAG